MGKGSPTATFKQLQYIKKLYLEKGYNIEYIEHRLTFICTKEQFKKEIYKVKKIKKYLLKKSKLFAK